MGIFKKLFSKKSTPVISDPDPKPKPNDKIPIDANLCRCVHCYKEFHKDDFLGICTSRDCENTEIVEQDILSMDYIPDVGNRRLLLRRESKYNIPSLDEEESAVDDIVNDQGRCSACSSHIFFYACPHCRKSMPYITAAELERVIAPAGIAASGKTTYMTVLISHLLNNPMHNTSFRLTTQFTEADDAREYTDTKYNVLFLDRAPLQMTAPTDVPKPYIIRSVSKQKDEKQDTRIHTLWYDFAGEALTGAGAQNPILQNLRAAKGIFLFIDPKNIQQTVDELELDTINTPNLMQDGIVLTTISQIISSGKADDDEMKSKFIAVILNKVDLFRDHPNSQHFNENSVIWSDSPHQGRGGFSIEDFEQVNEEVKDYVERYHPVLYNHLLPCLNEQEDNIGYFAVSTLGQEPNSEGLLDKEVSPIRVEDPYYWMLWKMKAIPGLRQAKAEDVEEYA